MMAQLNVNIDHVATVRQARRAEEPDPVWAAVECELAGAAGITMHLREDRRHVQDRDAELVRQVTQVKLNLEMAMTEAMVRYAIKLKPDQVTLVPEKRRELTTEGGLDCVKHQRRLVLAVRRLRGKGISVSAFIVPAKEQVEACTFASGGRLARLSRLRSCSMLVRRSHRFTRRASSIATSNPATSWLMRSEEYS